MPLPARRMSNAAKGGRKADQGRDYPAHRKWIRGHFCTVGDRDCAGRIEAAHVRIGTDGGASLKPSDWFTWPACSHHHALQHRIGEPEFERRYRTVFPRGLRQKALEFAFRSPVLEVRQGAKEASDAKA